MKINKNLYYSITTEFLFTIFPIIIISIIRCYREEYRYLFFNTEWSFASIVLFGQSIVKFSSGVSLKGKLKWQIVALLISILIIFGLVPSILVLTLAILNEAKTYVLYIWQIVLFFLSCISFFVIGLLGQYYIENEKD